MWNLLRACVCVWIRWSRVYLKGTQDEVEHQSQLRPDMLRDESEDDEVDPEEWDEQQRGLGESPVEPEHKHTPGYGVE